jgi:hypothetical protein
MQAYQVHITGKERIHACRLPRLYIRDRDMIAPRRMAERLRVPMARLARLAHVNRNTRTAKPESLAVQAKLGEIARIIARAAMKARRSSSFATSRSSVSARPRRNSSRRGKLRRCCGRSVRWNRAFMPDGGNNSARAALAGHIGRLGPRCRGGRDLRDADPHLRMASYLHAGGWFPQLKSGRAMLCRGRRERSSLRFSIAGAAAWCCGIGMMRRPWAKVPR